MHLQHLLKRYIKKLFSDLHAAIIGLFVVLALGSTVSIYLFWKEVWIVLKTTMKLPTPIWATTISVLSVLVYIYLKTRKTHSSSTPNFKIEYFPIDKLKWKTKIYKNNTFEVDETPLCLEHDLTFLFPGRTHMCCPEAIKKKCSNKIETDIEYSQIYENAKSYIEKQIRNKKC